METNVIHFYDERDGTINKQSDRYSNYRENPSANYEALVSNFVQSNRHDFSRENQVGAYGAGCALLFERSWVFDIVLEGLAVLLTAKLFDDLLSPFEGEVASSHHENKNDRLWKEPTQQKRTRQENQQLVLQTSKRNPSDDRKFAAGVEAGYITWSNSRIVDHNARSLTACPAGSDADVIDRCRSSTRDDRDVIQKSYKSAGHTLSP